MPSFTIHESQIPTFTPLPGFALLRVLPAELKTEGGIYKPEVAAEREMQREALRIGVVIRANHAPEPKGSLKKDRFLDQESVAIWPGVEVFYLGRADEMDNEFVIVKLGQIAAVIEKD